MTGGRRHACEAGARGYTYVEPFGLSRSSPPEEGLDRVCVDVEGVTARPYRLVEVVLRVRNLEPALGNV